MNSRSVSCSSDCFCVLRLWLWESHSNPGASGWRTFLTLALWSHHMVRTAECEENSSHKGSHWAVTELGSQPGQHGTEAGCHLPMWHPSFPSLFLHPEAPSVGPLVCLKRLKSGSCAVVEIIPSPFHPSLLGTAVTWGHVCVCSTCPYLLLLGDSWSCARLWFISSEKQTGLKIRTHSSKIRGYDNVELSEFTLTGDLF